LQNYGRNGTEVIKEKICKNDNRIEESKQKAKDENI